MPGKKYVALVLVLVFSSLLAGCGGKAPASPPPAAPPPAAKASAEWKSDGAVSDGEYTQTHKLGEIEVFSRVEGDSVMMALRARTKGYVALGIDPEDKMKGADMLLGYMKDGQAAVVDMYSTGVYGPHPLDTAQGGTADVAAVSGSHKDGVLVVEFKRKLATGDSKDKPLKMGDNKVIWAIGDVGADGAVKHSSRGAGTLTLKQ